MKMKMQKSEMFNKSQEKYWGEETYKKIITAVLFYKKKPHKTN